jgi:branched-subunit amino acid transport protein
LHPHGSRGVTRRRPLQSRFALVSATLIASLTLPAAFLLPCAGVAQDAAAIAPPVAGSEPAPIPLPSLVVEAESAERFARDVRERLAPSRELMQIEDALTALAPDLARRAERLSSLLAQPASLDALDAESKDWGARREQLARWQRAATERLVELEREIASLETRSEVWSRTRAAARETRAPAEALARIDGVRAALLEAHDDAREARRGLVELQSHIAQHAATIERGVERLAAARNDAETSLLESDSPTLWDALGSAADAWNPVAARLTSGGALAREYLPRSIGRLIAQAFAFALVAWLGFRGRPFATRVRSDARLAACAVVFERPLAAAGVVALLLTPLFHPHAPTGLLALSRVALIVSLLRLLPALAPRELFGAIVVAGVLALLGEVRVALGATPAVERGLLELELGVAAATLAWLMRPARLALLPSGQRVPPFLRHALRLAGLALLTAFAANALGWSNLAHLLGTGTLRSVYGALAVYGVSRRSASPRARCVFSASTATQCRRPACAS